jgi:hypothetical protein
VPSGSANVGSAVLRYAVARGPSASTVIATPSRVTGSVPVPGAAALNSTRMTSALADPTFSGLCVSAGV